jgi:chromosome segregation ATPase
MLHFASLWFSVHSKSGSGVMLKKIIIGGSSLLLAGGLFFGNETFSYLRTFGTQVRQTVKNEISVEFELQRIRDEVDSLMPEIRRHMQSVAEQSVDVKDLERTLAEREKSLSEQRASILTLRKDLDSGRDHFTYRAVSYSRAEVLADLAQRFESLQSAEAAAKRDHQILAAQREILHANQRRLDAMQARRQDLAVHVAQLEARLKQVQAAEALNSSPLDDSRLASVEKLIHDMNRALDIREAMLESEGRLSGRIPVEESAEPATDILSRIDSHFSAGKQPVETVSSSGGGGSGI